MFNKYLIGDYLTTFLSDPENVYILHSNGHVYVNGIKQENFVNFIFFSSNLSAVINVKNNLILKVTNTNSYEDDTFIFIFVDNENKWKAYRKQFINFEIKRLTVESFNFDLNVEPDFDVLNYDKSNNDINVDSILRKGSFTNTDQKVGVAVIYLANKNKPSVLIKLVLIVSRV